VATSCAVSVYGWRARWGGGCRPAQPHQVPAGDRTGV